MYTALINNNKTAIYKAPYNMSVKSLQRRLLARSCNCSALLVCLSFFTLSCQWVPHHAHGRRCTVLALYTQRRIMA